MRGGLPQNSGFSVILAVPFATVVILLVMCSLFFNGFCAAPGIRVEAASGTGGVFANPEVLQIVLDPAGRAFVNGNGVTETQLAEFLSAVASRNPSVLIRASNKAPLEACVRLWGQCEKAGIRNLNLITD